MQIFDLNGREVQLDLLLPSTKDMLFNSLTTPYRKACTPYGSVPKTTIHCPRGAFQQPLTTTKHFVLKIHLPHLTFDPLNHF